MKHIFVIVSTVFILFVGMSITPPQVAYATSPDCTARGPGVDLSGCRLLSGDANLTGADLTGADLTGAEINGPNLDGTTLTGAILTNAFIL